MQYPIFIASTRVPEIRGISSTNSDGTPYEEDGVFIGGATTIHDIQHALARMDGRAGPTAAGKEPGSGSVAGAFVDMLRWFGSAQIRNVACLAGMLEILDCLGLRVVCDGRQNNCRWRCLVQTVVVP